MNTLIIVFAVMMLFVVLMSVGVLMGRKPISGSCGGMAAVGMKGACDVCGGDLEKCESNQKGQGPNGAFDGDNANNAADNGLFYDASEQSTRQ